MRVFVYKIKKRAAWDDKTVFFTPQMAKIADWDATYVYSDALSLVHDVCEVIDVTEEVNNLILADVTVVIQNGRIHVDIEDETGARKELVDVLKDYAAKYDSFRLASI